MDPVEELSPAVPESSPGPAVVTVEPGAGPESADVLEPGAEPEPGGVVGSAPSLALDVESSAAPLEPSSTPTAGPIQPPASASAPANPSQQRIAEVYADATLKIKQNKQRKQLPLLAG